MSHDPSVCHAGRKTQGKTALLQNLHPCVYGFVFRTFVANSAFRPSRHNKVPSLCLHVLYAPLRCAPANASPHWHPESKPLPRCLRPPGPGPKPAPSSSRLRLSVPPALTKAAPRAPPGVTAQPLSVSSRQSCRSAAGTASGGRRARGPCAAHTSRCLPPPRVSTEHCWAATQHTAHLGPGRRPRDQLHLVSSATSRESVCVSHTAALVRALEQNRPR